MSYARDVTLSMSYEEEDACMSYAPDVTLSTCACCRKRPSIVSKETYVKRDLLSA
jgi:hypothetical protein